jgi:hypothetical protein
VQLSPRKAKRDVLLAKWNEEWWNQQEESQTEEFSRRRERERLEDEEDYTNKNTHSSRESSPFFYFLFLVFLPWRRQDTERAFGKTLTRSISVCVGLWVRVL